MLGSHEQLPKEMPHKQPEKAVKKPIEKMERPKHEAEHVDSTLNTGNRLKILIQEFSWEREDDGYTLDMEEPKQQELVYIMNLRNALQKDGMKWYDEEGPNKKKPAEKIGLLKSPP